MSGSEDWDRKDEMPVDERLKVLAAAAGEPKRKRPRPCDVAVGVAGGGRPAASGSASVEKEEPSSGAAPASRMRPESAAAATTAVAVEDTDALDCGVCFLPLKPPIFQAMAVSLSTHKICPSCKHGAGDGCDGEPASQAGRAAQGGVRPAEGREEEDRDSLTGARGCACRPPQDRRRATGAARRPCQALGAQCQGIILRHGGHR
ncbi:hypothetical protein PAHAL_3G121100 [Panicum hallii]|uniref:E3 ubiquitin-protein ligase n=1 Tax=Panicum hallii TaxID=206008 RepID=A0A2T8KHX2_9POAL|nr:hypothetical protein PAHAL_3G121100 [Panicum hallii]